MVCTVNVAKPNNQPNFTTIFSPVKHVVKAFILLVYFIEGFQGLLKNKGCCKEYGNKNVGIISSRVCYATPMHPRRNDLLSKGNAQNKYKGMEERLFVSRSS